MNAKLSGISRLVIAVVVIIIVIISAVSVYFLVISGTSTSNATSSVSSLTASSIVTASTNSSSTTSSTNSTLANSNTLSIDDIGYPSGGLNQLLAIQTRPYPDWLEVVTYQSLVVPNLPRLFNQGNITYMPDLAENWTVSSDGSTYTYNLRQGVHFSNGDPFNSYQVWTEMYGWYYLNGGGSNFLNGLRAYPKIVLR